jgi:hypothetical protein
VEGSGWEGSYRSRNTLYVRKSRRREKLSSGRELIRETTGTNLLAPLINIKNMKRESAVVSWWSEPETNSSIPF